MDVGEPLVGAVPPPPLVEVAGPLVRERVGNEVIEELGPQAPCLALDAQEVVTGRSRAACETRVLR